MTQPILEARGISRSFGHVRALANADFDIYPGEVVALIGDNGAGKSTLVKALTGNLALDEGQLIFDGKPVTISSPQEASALGMEVVYQDLALAPHLNPVQNMYLGREIPRKGIAADGAPWAVLSAGVDHETFIEQVRTAIAHGASGAMAGRSLWKNSLAVSPETRRDLLGARALPRRNELAAAVDAPRP